MTPPFPTRRSSDLACEQGQDDGDAGESDRAHRRRPPHPRHGRQAVSASSSSQLGSLLPRVRRKVQRSVVGTASLSEPAITLPSASRVTALIRSEEHTSELQSLMRISYADFCL